jgi:hypothetical protein
MRAMMQQAQQMQACMAAEGREPFERLRTKGNEAVASIRALCDSGRRDEARTAALRYGQEIAESEEMTALARCGEAARAMIPDFSRRMAAASGTAEAQKHVCDSMEPKQ